MLPPLPRHSSWKSSSLISPSRISLPRKGRRVGLCIVLFEACSAFTHVAACTLARSPIRDTLIRGFSHFVTSMTAPIASGWSGCRVGLAPTGKRRLVTAHTLAGQGCRRGRARGDVTLPIPKPLRLSYDAPLNRRHGASRARTLALPPALEPVGHVEAQRRRLLPSHNLDGGYTYAH